MFKLLLTLSLAFALVGCKEKHFSDPQAFVNRYGTEMLGAFFKDGMQIMDYRGFKFSDAKIGIDRMGREYVSAVVALKLPSGRKYYPFLEPPSARELLTVWPTDYVTRAAGTEEASAIRSAYQNAREDRLAPIIYGAKAVDLEKCVSPWCSIRIFRVKDGEGTYHPTGNIKDAVKWYAPNGDERTECGSIPTELFCPRPGGLLSEKAIETFCAVQEGTSDAKQSHASYMTRLAEINAAIARLNACCLTQAQIVAETNIRDSSKRMPTWVYERRQKVEAGIQAETQAVRRKFERTENEIRDSIYGSERVLRRLNPRVTRTENDLARLKNNLTGATQELEQLLASEAQAQHPSRRAQRKIGKLKVWVGKDGPKAVADTESMLASLKTQRQQEETRLAAAKERLAKVQQEGQSAVSKATADGQAALEKATRQLTKEYEVLRQASTQQMKTALAACRRKLGMRPGKASK